MRYILLNTVLIFSLPIVVYAQINTTENISPVETSIATESATEPASPHFPIITLGTGGGFILRNESAGGFGSASFDFQSDWAFAGISATLGVLGNSPDNLLFTEITGYGHLLAIGASDVTYRRYIDGDEVRFLGGFSYTQTHENIARVDVNLGVGYFDENQSGIQRQEWGLQISARARARFWRLENFLQFSVYQNLEVGAGEIDLSGTEIICENFEEVLMGEDLRCYVPESDPSEESSGSGLVNWQTTGFLITERLFLNAHEESDGGRWGPEVEIRVEKTPLRGINFWAMLSFRYYWSAEDI